MSAVLPNEHAAVELTDERVLHDRLEAIVSARNLARRYGSGDTAVDALARRLARRAAGRARRRHGPVGLGQVDADAPARRPRPAHRGHRRDRRPRHHDDVRHRADEAAPRAHRLRLPVLQPAADADRGGERDAAAADRRQEGRRRLARPRARPGRARRSSRAPPVGALRRPAAARRHRARAPLEAVGAVRRRADRQPRLDHVGRDPRGAARGGRGLRPDDDHGHPRREGRGDRRPHPLPRRRPGRARARPVELVGGHRRAARGHAEDDVGRAQGSARPQAARRSDGALRSCSASRWSAARSCSPTRSRRRSTRCSRRRTRNTDAVDHGQEARRLLELRERDDPGEPARDRARAARRRRAPRA